MRYSKIRKQACGRDNYMPIFTDEWIKKMQSMYYRTSCSVRRAKNREINTVWSDSCTDLIEVDFFFLTTVVATTG